MSAPDWSRTSQAFRHLDGSLPQPPRRVTTPDGPGGIELFRTFPAVRKEYQRGRLHGWVQAMVFYTIATTVLVLGFVALGVRP
jgi:hypothetical protein